MTVCKGVILFLSCYVYFTLKHSSGITFKLLMRVVHIHSCYPRYDLVWSTSRTRLLIFTRRFRPDKSLKKVQAPGYFPKLKPDADRPRRERHARKIKPEPALARRASMAGAELPVNVNCCIRKIWCGNVIKRKPRGRPFCDPSRLKPGGSYETLKWNINLGQKWSAVRWIL